MTARVKTFLHWGTSGELLLEGGPLISRRAVRFGGGVVRGMWEVWGTDLMMEGSVRLRFEGGSRGGKQEDHRWEERGYGRL